MSFWQCAQPRRVGCYITRVGTAYCCTLRLPTSCQHGRQDVLKRVPSVSCVLSRCSRRDPIPGQRTGDSSGHDCEYRGSDTKELYNVPKHGSDAGIALCRPEREVLEHSRRETQHRDRAEADDGLDENGVEEKSLGVTPGEDREVKDFVELSCVGILEVSWARYLSNQALITTVSCSYDPLQGLILRSIN